jgi:hypothetical protein
MWFNAFPPPPLTLVLWSLTPSTCADSCQELRWSHSHCLPSNVHARRSVTHSSHCPYSNLHVRSSDGITHSSAPFHAEFTYYSSSSGHGSLPTNLQTTAGVYLSFYITKTQSLVKRKCFFSPHECFPFNTINISSISKARNLQSIRIRIHGSSMCERYHSRFESVCKLSFFSLWVQPTGV